MAERLRKRQGGHTQRSEAQKTSRTKSSPEGRFRIKLHSLNKHSESSKRWLLRQLNDPYVARAKVDGYRSRAAYKLLEIHQKFGLFKTNQVIVDIGCAPGGWLQVASRLAPDSLRFGVDIQAMAPIDDVIFFQGDMTEEVLVDELRRHLNGRKVDVVLSDMAASACGIPKVDYIRIVTLVQAAANFATQVLAPGGVFVAKVLRGGTPSDLLSQLKKQFAFVDHFKPKASRSDSSEIYLVARSFRGVA